MQKVSPHWCLNDKPNWQEGTEREGERRRRTATLSITRAQTGSTHERTSPPTLPKHHLTWQITMCESLPGFLFFFFPDTAGICHIFVRALRWNLHRDKEIQNEPTCHPPPPPPHLSLFLLSVHALPCLSPPGIVQRSRNMEQKSTSHAA